MAKNILLNSAELTGALLAANLASSAIDTKRDTWTPQEEESIALEAFAAQFVALEEVMALYQSLLNRDLEAARKVGMELITSDTVLSTLWK